MKTRRTSLLHIAAQDRPTCSTCGTDQVTQLSMTVANGTLLTLVACHRCEVRTWRDGEDVLPLTEVLYRARKQA